MQGFKKAVTLFSSLTIVSFSSAAFAIMSAPYGWYAEANGGSSSISGKSYPGNASTSGLGGSVNLGYKIMPYAAVEGNYTQYSNTSINVTSSGTKAGTDKHYSFGIVAKGMFPVSDTGVEIFGKIGASQMRSSLTINNNSAADLIGLESSNHSQIGLFWGGGASFFFMPEFGITGQYMRAQGSSSTGTGSLLSAGLTFIFG